MIKTSKIADSIQTSFTRQLFNLAKQYDDVIDITLGDPDLQPHDSIKAAACHAIQAGMTRYSQNAGLLELRKSISERYLNNEKLFYNPESEIIATVGGMEGLYLALLSLLDEDDEVIIPAPYYVNYVQMVRMCHAKPVVAESVGCNNLEISIPNIESAITSRTRVIIINTPCNPSGKIIPTDKLHNISLIAKKYNLVVIADEVYKCLTYDNSEWCSIASFDGMRERTLLVNSLSKEFCMTGYRIGYVVGPSEVVSAMTKLQENVAACAPLPSQYAAIKALEQGSQYSKNMIETFTQRRNYLVENINKIIGLDCVIPDATFYLMVNISQSGMKSVDFAMKLLDSVHVAVVPGITYGKCCDNYIRIAFTKDVDVLSDAVNRISKFMSSIVK